jgi:type II secretory pathway component PulF
VVKLRHKGLLVLGLPRKELEALQAGFPLPVMLEDVGLKGQVIYILAGENNEQLERVMKKAADAYERGGASSVIEVAKHMPKQLKN